MKLKRVKLNYRSAVTRTQPVGTIPISGSHMEKLDRAIKQKVRQNMTVI